MRKIPVKTMWPRQTLELPPRTVKKARAWIPLKLKSGRWCWGEEIFVESTYGLKSLYYTEDELFIEGLITADEIAISGKIWFYPVNPYAFFIFLPLFIVICILLIIVINYHKIK